MKNLFKLADFLKSLLFVENCRNCQITCLERQQARSVCRRCWQEISLLISGLSLLPLSESISVPVISGAIYTGIIKKLVYKLKYDGDRLIAYDLALLACSSMEKTGAFLPAENGILVPVPLHEERLAERGYNQSFLIARHIGHRLGLQTAEKALRRHKATAPQHGLNRMQRSSNIAGAISGVPDLIAGAHVILVDDICTSGATLCEAARASIMCGAAKVSAITAARAIFR